MKTIISKTQQIGLEFLNLIKRSKNLSLNSVLRF